MEVAALMPEGVGEKAVRAAIAAGQLPCQRVGRYVLVPTAALLHQLQADQSPNSSAAGVDAPAVALPGPAAATKPPLRSA